MVSEGRVSTRRGAGSGHGVGFDAIDHQMISPFDGSHMIARPTANDADSVPMIADMTAAAAKVPDRNEEGFVLMVEGGRVDHTHPAGNAARAPTGLLALAEAVHTA